MIKKIITITFLCLLVATPLFTFGEEDEGRELEIVYPGEDAPGETSAEVGSYVKYIFNFAFGLLGVVLFGSLVYAGFLYLISAGNPEKRSEAKNRIIAAFLGAILLLSFYVILNTINPDILDVSLEEPDDIEYPPIPAGPYVCNFQFAEIDGILSNYESEDTRNDAIMNFYEKLKEEDDDKYCREIKSPQDIRLDADDYSYFVVPTIEDETHYYDYGMIFFDSKNGLERSRGWGDGVECDINIGTPSEYFPDFDTRSVAPIKIDRSGETAKVVFYEAYYYNQLDKGSHNQEYKKSEGDPNEWEVSLAPGTTDRILSISDISSHFVCGKIRQEWTLQSKENHCGLRSVEAYYNNEPRVFVVFKNGDLCNITNYDRENLVSLLPSLNANKSKGDINKDGLKGLMQVFRMDSIQIIKGQLMDTKR